MRVLLAMALVIVFSAIVMALLVATAVPAFAEMIGTYVICLRSGQTISQSAPPFNCVGPRRLSKNGVVDEDLIRQGKCVKFNTFNDAVDWADGHCLPMR